MAPEMDTGALDALGQQLGDPKFRREFHQDPQRALRSAGINSGDLPENFLAALAELSTTELRLVGDLAAHLQGTAGPQAQEGRPGALGFPF